MQTQGSDPQIPSGAAQPQRGTGLRSRDYVRQRGSRNTANLVYRVKQVQNTESPAVQREAAPPQPAVTNPSPNINTNVGDANQPQQDSSKRPRRQRRPRRQQNQNSPQVQQPGNEEKAQQVPLQPTEAPAPGSESSKGGNRKPRRPRKPKIFNSQGNQDQTQTQHNQNIAQQHGDDVKAQQVHPDPHPQPTPSQPAEAQAPGVEKSKRGDRRPRRPRKERQPNLTTQGQTQDQQNQVKAPTGDQHTNSNANVSAKGNTSESAQGPARRRRTFRERIDSRYGNCSEEIGPRRRQGKGAEAAGKAEPKQEAPSAVEDTKDPERPVESEGEFFYEVGKNCFGIKKGFVPNMNVEGQIFVNEKLRQLLMDELKVNTVGGFLPAVKQVANVASLPGILQYSMGMPDIHCGYGFAIGNVAAFDMGNPDAVVSPGGVGFDINCGVRLVRTNLMEEEVSPHKEELAQLLFEKIPVGVGAGGSVKATQDDLKEILNTGVDWAIKNGLAWPEDKEFCEENGHMKSADASKVSARAMKRGMGELGSLGAGNHYCEIQVVDEILDQEGANALGLGKVGQVCAMVHCGSRGLGHQIATDFLMKMEKAQNDQKIQLNDRQLACARINSEAGQDYLKAMACAANFAWVNRQGIMHQIRQSFEKVFNKSARDMDMQLVYDVSHNTAKVEDHIVNGEQKQLLVHRKGATRAFPPNHKLIPKAYSSIGQPVFIGGSMGTNSYVLLGTQQGMERSWGSTCHGAGRCLSRHKSRTTVSSKQVMDRLASQGVAIRIQTPKLVMEEAPETYKDVKEVVRVCDEAGLSKICVKLRPLAVVKG